MAYLEQCDIRDLNANNQNESEQTTTNDNDEYGPKKKVKVQYRYRNTIQQEDLGCLAERQVARYLDANENNVLSFHVGNINNDRYSYRVFEIHNIRDYDIQLDALHFEVINSSMAALTEQEESFQKLLSAMTEPGKSGQQGSAAKSFFSVKALYHRKPDPAAAQQHGDIEIVKLGDKSYHADDRDFVRKNSKSVAIVCSTPSRKIVLEKNCSYYLYIGCYNCSLLTSFTNHDDLYKRKHSSPPIANAAMATDPDEFDLVKTYNPRNVMDNILTGEEFHFSIGHARVFMAHPPVDIDIDDLNYPFLTFDAPSERACEATTAAETEAEEDDEVLFSYFCGNIDYTVVLTEERDLRRHFYNSIDSIFVSKSAK